MKTNNPKNNQVRSLLYPKIVEVLRRAGITVRVSHYRHVVTHGNTYLSNFITPKLRLVTEMNKGLFHTILAFGGETHIQVVFPDAEDVVLEAKAACSLKDQYCRKSGIDVAFERLGKTHPKVIDYYNQYKTIYGAFNPQPNTLPDSGNI